TRGFMSARFATRSCRHPRDREAYGEARAPAGTLAHPDVSPVRLDDLLGDREAQAGPARTRGEEGLEDALAELLRDAGTRIGDGELHGPVAHARAERDLSPRRDRLGRVGEEAEEHLAEEVGVGPGGRQRGRLVAGQPDVLRRELLGGEEDGP